MLLRALLFVVVCGGCVLLCAMWRFDVLRCVIMLLCYVFGFSMLSLCYVRCCNDVAGVLLIIVRCIVVLVCVSVHQIRLLRLLCGVFRCLGFSSLLRCCTVCMSVVRFPHPCWRLFAC